MNPLINVNYICNPDKANLTKRRISLKARIHLSESDNGGDNEVIEVDTAEVIDERYCTLEPIFITGFSYNLFISSCQKYLLYPFLPLSFIQAIINKQ